MKDLKSYHKRKIYLINAIQPQLQNKFILSNTFIVKLKPSLLQMYCVNAQHMI